MVNISRRRFDMIRALSTLLLTIFSCSFAETRALTFAPSPLNNTQKVLEEFTSIVSYLEEQSGQKINFVYEKKYNDMISSFKENKIDLAYFGPLPLATLQKSFPAAVPLLTFNEKDGKSGYRCVLVKFAKDEINFKKSKNIKVALTQPLSSCGYMQTKILLKAYADKNIEEMKFEYLDNHEEVALSIIRGDFIIGGMKESIAKEYQSLGLKILQTSPMLPSFTLVANANTLTKEEREKIKQILQNAPKEVYSKWGKSISYGFSETNMELFEALKIDKLNYNIPQKGNF